MGARATKFYKKTEFNCSCRIGNWREKTSSTLTQNALRGEGRGYGKVGSFVGGRKVRELALMFTEHIGYTPAYIRRWHNFSLLFVVNINTY